MRKAVLGSFCAQHARNIITVADGYNGSTVELDLTPLHFDNQCVKLAVASKPWLIRWIYRTEWNAATALRDRISKQA